MMSKKPETKPKREPFKYGGTRAAGIRRRQADEKDKEEVVEKPTRSGAFELTEQDLNMENPFLPRSQKVLREPESPRPLRPSLNVRKSVLAVTEQQDSFDKAVDKIINKSIPKLEKSYTRLDIDMDTTPSKTNKRAIPKLEKSYTRLDIDMDTTPSKTNKRAIPKLEESYTRLDIDMDTTPSKTNKRAIPVLIKNPSVDRISPSVPETEHVTPNLVGRPSVEHVTAPRLVRGSTMIAQNTSKEKIASDLAHRDFIANRNNTDEILHRTGFGFKGGKGTPKCSPSANLDPNSSPSVNKCRDIGILPQLNRSDELPSTSRRGCHLDENSLQQQLRSDDLPSTSRRGCHLDENSLQQQLRTDELPSSSRRGSHLDENSLRSNRTMSNDRSERNSATYETRTMSEDRSERNITMPKDRSERNITMSKDRSERNSDIDETRTMSEVRSERNSTMSKNPFERYSGTDETRIMSIDRSEPNSTMSKDRSEPNSTMSKDRSEPNSNVDETRTMPKDLSKRDSNLDETRTSQDRSRIDNEKAPLQAGKRSVCDEPERDPSQVSAAHARAIMAAAALANIAQVRKASIDRVTGRARPYLRMAAMNMAGNSENNMYTRREHRNSNLLNAVLSLIREMDPEYVETLCFAIHDYLTGDSDSEV